MKSWADIKFELYWSDEAHDALTVLSRSLIWAGGLVSTPIYYCFH